MVSLDDINRIPLFEGLGAPQRNDLASIAVPRVFSRGGTIFSEGEEGTGFHVVLRGRVKIFKLSPEGKEQILHIWGAGEPFGEVAVFQGESFPAHAEALEDCRTLFFPRPGLLALIRGNPEFALQLLAVLARRLRRLADLVETLSLLEVPSRLAAYVLLLEEQQAGGGRVTLDLSKSDVASLLGTIPETLSRILARMTREGWIAPDGTRGLRLLNRGALRELARAERRLPG